LRDGGDPKLGWTSVHITTPRTFLVAAATAALSLLTGAQGVVAQVGPPATTTTTQVPTSTTTTTAAPTTTSTPPTTGPETRILPYVPPAGTKIVDPSAAGSGTTTSKPGDPAASTTTVPPASLSAGAVDFILRDQQRTGASSTAALVEALKPLLNLGMTPHEALTQGMGQFPLLGVANWTDDWLDYRAGPPVHQHQGTDVFAAFDVPVRAPVDGTVRFEDSGLGGKGVFVTAPDGTYYYMAHLNSFAPDLANGAKVKQGQIVGLNGDSGNAKGGAPHVHFEVHPFGGAAVNAKPFLDAWLAAAMARVPEVLASFQPKPAEGEPLTIDDGGVPQILLTTGLTRRFTSPSLPVPRAERRDSDPLNPVPVKDPSIAD
jgi:murein DD-endopeptidase MepM/ murein hydrolase activator NlpD